MVTVGGRSVAITHPDREFYPARGRSGAVTKSDVVGYYREIAPVILPLLCERPVTRKRWPRGVAEESFFEKQLPSSAPDWIDHCTLVHRTHRTTYPMADSEATLTWLGQQAALELHVPQWRHDRPDPGSDAPDSPGAFLADRLVFDLDPGEQTGLTDCARVATAIRDLTESNGLTCHPVTSGSKGIHLYVALDRPVTSDDAVDVARRVADEVAGRHPRTVTTTMRKSERRGKVFIDWSQNNGAKTTVAPYSLRGRARPTVAAPRTWEEIEGPALRQLTFDEVLRRVDEHGDLLADLVKGSGPDRSRGTGHAYGTRGGTGRLGEYRARRHSGRTPEPLPETDSRGADGGAGFVIQEHHASTLHWDFRLERDGVLVSWAVPKNLPVSTGQDRLAVHTEDHPLEYASFEGEIPQDQYGGGRVEIWDSGPYSTVKWRDDEVVVDLHGERLRGRYALIHTPGVGRRRGRRGTKSGGDGADGGHASGTHWLVHLMQDQPEIRPPGTHGSGDRPSTGKPSGDGAGQTTATRRGSRAPFPRGLRPMLATPGDIIGLDPDEWAFEGKWDGHRVIIEVRDAAVRLHSRNGRDVTDELGRFAALAEDLDGHDAVLDAELVAPGARGIPDFARLQRRTAATELRLYVFDILHLDGRSLLRVAYRNRRKVLDALAPLLHTAEVPAPYDCGPREAMRRSSDDGLEGIIAKRLGSRYADGRRSDAWIKHKHFASDELVIGGYTRGSGSRAETFGALLLGEPDGGGRLRYAGKVGTGFDEHELVRLTASMHRIRRKTSPFNDAVPRSDAPDPLWVTPRLVGEIRHSGRTEAGRFRHPSWRSLRSDKSPVDL
ncbi:ATP-dependent DNA ligase [Tomitella gaofuii]|uniref:ATP-dependent DNA ligase n=1 Tax=Tomitella gaofuii TaxID=2760083 RepID=UPI0020BE7A75|nr:ATP-dependent DNA ligase [Tomitella gaofuii]